MIAAVAVIVLSTASVEVPTLVARATVPDWLIAQCDVGQVAATALRVGDETVLIDTDLMAELEWRGMLVLRADDASTIGLDGADV